MGQVTVEGTGKQGLAPEGSRQSCLRVGVSP